jgi:predicted ATP-dependent protease
MDMQEETFMQFARMIGNFCTEQKLRHLTNTGVARIIEYSVECTEDWNKISLELGNIKDLLLESDYYADLDGDEYIKDIHVEKAISKRIFRANLVEERVKELVKRDIFWIETEGKKTGQINGLSILMTGDHEFGKPGRITATVSVGREGIITIERESKMSGKIHTKGVMILSSFLKEKFAHNKPLSLTATICFEQSYGLIDGDSASSAELFVLLSAIGDIPIYQGIAVTGSVSQKGEIQPVGGVTKKIEGFFDICQHKGLDGKQGVIIPSRNVENLMLKHEVIESVRNGKFHIWPISRIDDGIEILTGMKAGTMTEDGTYSEDTVFGKVDRRLTELAQVIKRFGKEEEEREKHKDQ